MAYTSYLTLNMEEAKSITISIWNQNLKKDADQVKLFGAWPSPFVHRVMWALKLKGIEYEYVDEDINNKSDLLLKYNPVHKKVPVLVHRGKPIVESIVILEYIEEMWPDNYSLLPKDPFERAVARFWAKILDDKGPTTIWPFFISTGEEHEKAVKENLEMLRNIEEHGPWEKKFFNGDEIGLADLGFGALAYWLETMEEIVGVKLLEVEKFPRLCAWMERFKQVPVIKENLPNRERMLKVLSGRREYFQQQFHTVAK